MTVENIQVKKNTHEQYISLEKLLKYYGGKKERWKFKFWSARNSPFSMNQKLHTVQKSIGTNN